MEATELTYEEPSLEDIIGDTPEASSVSGDFRFFSHTFPFELSQRGVGSLPL